METENQTKISVKIIDAFKDEYVWAREFQSAPEDIHRLFSKISQGIAQEIGAEQIIQEMQRSAALKPVNPVAYELYFQGNYHLQRDDTKTAIEFFEKAIAVDSTYVEPYTGLIYAYDMLNFRRDLPRAQGLAKEKELINKAMVLDSTSAEVYAGLATYLVWQEWDWEGAGKAFKRAFEINPYIAGRGASEYVWYLFMMGETDKAIEQAEKIVKQDPLSMVGRDATIRAYLYAERYQEAIKHCQRYSELNAGTIGFDWTPADIYDLMGEHDLAHEFRLSLIREGNVRSEFTRPGKTNQEILASYDSLYNEIGPKAYGKWLWEGRDREQYKKHPYLSASHYLGFGENNRALDYLEKAYEVRDARLLHAINNPVWKPVREYPRFKALMRKMNVPN
jgi:tetratricopeptide (TPR) repeat protein